MMKVSKSSDGKLRCQWSNTAPEFIHYHDKEWGFPVSQDIQLFEKLCLESFQSGLSWRTIYNKRDNFRNAFCHFDFNKIAKFTTKDIKRLLSDPGIVRHRGKIEAVIHNARQVQILIQQEGSLASFVWKYEPTKRPQQKSLVSTSPESITLSKELRKRGWKFVGPTTVYSFMQAMGLVNDHAQNCTTHSRVEAARKKFKRPKAS